MRYNLNINAKTKWGKLLQLCMLAAIPAFFGCANDGDGIFEGDTVPMTLYLQTSGAHQTRAYIGEVAANEAESQIKTVKVWFFDGETPVSYATSNSNKVTINVPQAAINKGSVDAYIIANGDEAVKNYANLGDGSTLSVITQSIMDVDKFSPATPVTAVPATGLPMSRIVKGLALTQGGEVKPNLGEIEITRAVSKIIFAFGKYTGDTFGVVDAVTLDAKISAEQYVFPLDETAQPAAYADPYLGDLTAHVTADTPQAAAMTLGSATDPFVTNANIHPTETTDNPSNYTWTNWIAKNPSITDNQARATKYMTDIAPFITKTVYLRESDQQLTGTIQYSIHTTAGVETKTVPFTMDAAQDFARNHVWIVYSYFEGGKLYVKPTVADWINATELNYTMKMSTSMRLFDSWLYRYDTDGKDYFASDSWGDPLWSSNWETSHMAVSSGRVATPVAPEVVAGRPLRSPQIQLVTTGVGTFDLVVDNSDFEIVRANKNDIGVVTSYDTSSEGKLTIAAGDDVHTYFYIVPKEDATPAEPEAKVSLIYNDPVLGPQRVTFNNNALPGYSDDSSEIWAYYVAPDDYRYIVDVVDGVEKPRYLKMYYQDANNPLVPTPVQN